MPITTVNGPLSKTELGVILPHEHVFIDLTNQFTEPTDPGKRRLSRASITLPHYGALRRNPYAIRDNLILDDLETAVQEVGGYKAAGGTTLIDCTSIGIHRSPARLREVSERTGIHIVAGCGYYTHDTHPPEMTRQSAEAIAETMVRDLTAGIDGTGICAGVIGEIGTSDPIRPSEVTSLMAAALAHRQTGAPLQIHAYPWGQAGLQAVRMLADAGVDPARVVICHVDVAIDLAYIRDLLKAGAYVEFDNFGKEFYIDSADRIGFSGGIFASDLERVRAIKTLVEAGHERRVLITNDICLKQMLCRYGGWGYGHILRHIVPMMADEGIPRSAIDRFVRDNPADWLCPADSCPGPDQGTNKPSRIEIARIRKTRKEPVNNKTTTLRDHFWLWGQNPGSHHISNGESPFKLPGTNRMDSAEGGVFFGIPNCCRVAMTAGPVPPFDAESKKLKGFKQVVWSAVGAGGVTRNNDDQSDLDEVLRQAEKHSNVTGAVLDDFFVSEESFKATGKIARHSVRSITAMRDALHSFAKRPLDLWMVWYDHQLHFDVDAYIKLCDVVTLWTWKGSALAALDKNMKTFVKRTPGKRRLAGCYMWNYGERKPLTMKQMKGQLDRYYQGIQEGEIEGIVFCSNCIADIGLKTVEWTRKWIADVGDESR